MSARFARAEELPSDAPLLSERATDVETGREVLLRRLDPAFSGDPQAAELFRSEIAAAAALPGTDPFLAPVAWSDGADPFLARPFAPWGALEARLGARFAAEQVAAWVGWLAGAVSALHELGLAHGDPSPRNVLLLSELGEPRLADPASARLRYAAARSIAPDEARVRDAATVLRLLDRLLEGTAARDEEATLRSELVRIRFCNLPDAGKLDAVRRLSGGDAPTAPPAPQPPRDQDAAAGIHAIVVAGPYADRAAHEQARRACLPFLAASAADVKAANGDRTVAAEVEWPHPAAELAALLRPLGAPVRIACRLGGRFA